MEVSYQKEYSFHLSFQLQTKWKMFRVIFSVSSICMSTMPMWLAQLAWAPHPSVRMLEQFGVTNQPCYSVKSTKEYSANQWTPYRGEGTTIMVKTSFEDTYPWNNSDRWGVTTSVDAMRWVIKAWEEGLVECQSDLGPLHLDTSKLLISLIFIDLGNFYWFQGAH